ncbi:hypothetical protein IIU_06938 [Bacillus cereus VD133]|uniref:Uncharacterized protein n=1 Tax=Bacillus cereus VD133 TaxID=1053233 RepID=A0A9W5PJ94_BACCE|nr:hypothetical protein [Bacillus cereus]EOO23734.1 hypothetical protein IIU_06938 [Bacillus cereus VD133]
MNSTMDYKDIYQQLLNNNEIPSVASVNSSALKYETRNLFVDLGEVYSQISQNNIHPKMISIYADVVHIPADFKCTFTDMELVIRARRIEVESKGTAEFQLDYRSEHKSAKIVLYAMGISGTLHGTAIYDQGEQSSEIEITNKGIRLFNQDNKLVVQPIKTVVFTDDLQVLCTSIFQVACLFFESYPNIAANQFKWLQKYAYAKKELILLCVQSTALFSILTADRGTNTFVPVLDKKLYKEQISSFLDAAKLFEEQYQRYKDRDLAIEDRKKAATLMFQHEQDTVLCKEILIKQTQNNLSSAKQSVESSLNQFKKQQLVIKLAEIDFKLGLEEYKYEQELKMAFEVVSAIFDFAESIGSILVTDGAAAPAEVTKIAEAAKTLESVAEAGATFAQLAKELKDCIDKVSKIVELIKKVDELAQAISEASTEMQFSDDLLQKIANHDWAIPQEDLTGDEEWKVFRLKIQDALADAVDKGIDGATEYRLALETLSIYGQTLTTNQLTLIRCSQELARLLIEKQMSADDAARLKDYIAHLDGQESENIVMEQKLYQRYLDIKRTLFVAFENYKHAYKYWALQDSSVQPNILKDIAELQVDVGLLQEDCMAALTQFNPPPQPFQNRILEITDPQILQELKDKREASWGIHLYDPIFDKEFRVRLKVIRTWLDGIEPDSKVKIQINNSGHYFDSFSKKELQFNTEPFNLAFSYQGEQIDVDGTIAEEFAYDFFIPNPFTTWTIKILDGPDLSNVTKIRMELEGTLVTDYNCNKNDFVIKQSINS